MPIGLNGVHQWLGIDYRNIKIEKSPKYQFLNLQLAKKKKDCLSL